MRSAKLKLKLLDEKNEQLGKQTGLMGMSGAASRAAYRTLSLSLFRYGAEAAAFMSMEKKMEPSTLWETM